MRRVELELPLLLRWRVSSLPRSNPMWFRAFMHWPPGETPVARRLAWCLCTLAKQGHV